MEEKSNLLSEQVAKSANNLEGKSGVAKRTCSVIKQVRVNEVLKDMFIEGAFRIKGSKVSSFYLTEKWLDGNHPTEAFYDDIMYLNYSEGWKTEYYKTFGRCYTYTIPKWIKKQRVCFNFFDKIFAYFNLYE